MVGRSRAFEGDPHGRYPGTRIFLLELAKRAGFPYKPATIDPGKCLTLHRGLRDPGPLVSAAGVMTVELN